MIFIDCPLCGNEARVAWSTKRECVVILCLECNKGMDVVKGSELEARALSPGLRESKNK